ncbi:MAG TPA: hypothetical protein PKC55_10525 [Dysgonomonas sp.]|uniref:hypothetical protein n=1 Tax=unclassified Dysgonomonas TaxID=2630389 RepID=UPI0025BE413C|nr:MULTISPECIES: hypothetical protein [unclassified Dysgonomonas]HML65255.1 hypothetical protein [Dysgonomonas sp.]
MPGKNVCEQNGYRDRMGYLKSLADDYGTDMIVVSGIAEVLGENEDFDSLMNVLEDIPIL